MFSRIIIASNAHKFNNEAVLTFNPNRSLEPVQILCIVEHIVWPYSLDVAGYVKRIRQVRCRQANKRWTGSDGNNLKQQVSGLTTDWGLISWPMVNRILNDVNPIRFARTMLFLSQTHVSPYRPRLRGRQTFNPTNQYHLPRNRLNSTDWPYLPCKVKACYKSSMLMPFLLF